MHRYPMGLSMFELRNASRPPGVIYLIGRVITVFLGSVKDSEASHQEHSGNDDIPTDIGRVIAD